MTTTNKQQALKNTKKYVLIDNLGELTDDSCSFTEQLNEFVYLNRTPKKSYRPLYFNLIE